MCYLCLLIRQLILEFFQGRPCIRQLIDEVADPPCLVLEHLDDDLLNAAKIKKLDRIDIKFVATNILKALKEFHEAGYVHTGMLITPGFGFLHISRSSYL
jgi:hypothetical protein